MSRTAQEPRTLADVANRGLNPDTPPAPPAAPQGQRIDGYFGVGLLRPGVGKMVQRTGAPQYCGAVVCRLYGYTESPSQFGRPGEQPRISTRFAGEFFGITYEGKRINSAAGYVPSSIESSMKAALDQGAAPVQFAGEIWCEPDEPGGRSTPLGYRFVVYDRRPRGLDDPLTQLAAAAGIIAPPALPAPAGDDGEVDPETGEIREATPTAA